MTFAEELKEVSKFRIQEETIDLFDTILSDFQKNSDYEVEIVNEDQVIIKKRNG